MLDISISELGKTLNTEKNTGTPYNYLCTSNVRWNSFDLSVVKKLLLEDDELERYKVQKGDLLICEGGDVGRAAIWEKDDDIYYQNALHRVRFMDAINQYFYLHVLHYYKLLGIIDDVSGGVTIKHFTQNSIKKLYFPLPPLAEQDRIVSAIEQWFTLINILEDAKGDLQNLISQAKSKILDLAIHGKLVPQDPTDEPAIELLKRINPKFTPCDNEHYGNLPNGWCICRIRDLFQICMGQSPAGTSINQNDGMEFHQGKICFTDKFLGQSKILTNSPTKIADANSLLICVRAPVGVLNINTRQICIGRGLCALLPSKCVNLGFAFHCLTTYQQQFEQKSTGSTFKAISGDIIKNELFPLPPLAEQHRIVAKIEELFAPLDAIENSLQA